MAKRREVQPNGTVKFVQPNLLAEHWVQGHGPSVPGQEPVVNRYPDKPPSAFIP